MAEPNYQAIKVGAGQVLQFERKFAALGLAWSSRTGASLV
jgi:hypothetical protein